MILYFVRCNSKSFPVLLVLFLTQSRRLHSRKLPVLSFASTKLHKFLKSLRSLTLLQSCGLAFNWKHTLVTFRLNPIFVSKVVTTSSHIYLVRKEIAVKCNEKKSLVSPRLSRAGFGFRASGLCPEENVRMETPKPLLHLLPVLERKCYSLLSLLIASAYESWNILS